MTCRYPLYIEEERHRALGRDATFPWSRALTGPRTRHRVVRGRGGHLGAAILACDVIYAKGAPILLQVSVYRTIGPLVLEYANLQNVFCCSFHSQND